MRCRVAPEKNNGLHWIYVPIDPSRPRRYSFPKRFKNVQYFINMASFLVIIFPAVRSTFPNDFFRPRFGKQDFTRKTKRNSHLPSCSFVMSPPVTGVEDDYISSFVLIRGFPDQIKTQCFLLFTILVRHLRFTD